MLKTIAIENYRSLQDVAIDLRALNLITGPNGSGKSNVYRALGLIRDIVRDGALNSLASEGGLQNALFAGKRSTGRVSMRLGIATEDLNYAIDLGLPQLGPFPLDPEVKSETVWHGLTPRPSSILAERKGQSVVLMDDSGARTVSDWTPRVEESMLATLTDPSVSPELYSLRESARAWQFYDNLRVDATAPARQPTPATFTPTLAPDGAGLAAALATVLRVGDSGSLLAAVASAFDGASVDVVEDDRGIARVAFGAGLKRPLDATELSDGSLRFLMLATILHSPRPPQLLVLNEPESSLHPSLLPALAHMIKRAAQKTQIIVVSHAAHLFDELGADTHRIELESGRPTAVAGQSLLSEPGWTWPSSRK